MRDDLFQLVKSLSKNEKRYFTLQASMHRKEARHLFLFNAIDRQKAYDEGALRELFRKKGYTEQISVAKNYLYALILKVLRSYHSTLTVNSELKEMLRNMEILFNKGLFDQCERVLNKVAAIAKSNSMHHHMIEINMWRRNLLSRREAWTKDREQLLREHGELYDETTWIINDYQMVNTSHHAFGLITTLSPLNTAEEMNQLREMMPAMIIDGEITTEASYIARINFIYTRISYFRLMHDLEPHRQYCREFIELVTGPEGPALKNGSHTVAGYEQLLWNLCYGEQFNEAAAVLPLMEASVYTERYNARPALQGEMVLVYQSYRLTVLRGLGEFRTSTALIPKILKHMQGYESYIEETNTVPLRFNIATAYFGAGDFKKSLRWLQGILNTGSADFAGNRGLVYSMARVLQLLIHLELGHDDLLDYLLKSYYRFLARKEKRYGMEDALLRCMRRMLKRSDRNDLNNELSLLADELRQLRLDPFEREPCLIVDLLAWAESRMEGISFGEIIRRNNEKRISERIAAA